VNGEHRPVSWEGRYALIGEVQGEDAVNVTFPITERTVEVEIERQHYILTLKGNEVINIEPPGQHCPLYQREHYRQNVTRWKKVQRFVSDEPLYW